MSFFCGPTEKTTENERLNGKRTFKLIEGGPLQTSFGEDLYQRVFETGN